MSDKQELPEQEEIYNEEEAYNGEGFYNEEEEAYNGEGFYNEEECLNNEEEEEEAEIIIVSEEECTFDPTLEKKLDLENIIKKFNLFVPDLPICLTDESISFSIPLYFLPVTLRVAFGFMQGCNLVDVDFTLTDFKWNTKPKSFVCTNEFNRNYCGKSLIYKAVEEFFSPNYNPKNKIFRSAPMFLSKGHAEPDMVACLEEMGYSHFQSVRAACLLDNDYEQCVTFLQTGQYQSDKPFKIPTTYMNCPLLYLVLEIFDSILNLQDHCSICGAYTFPGLKPSICKDNQVCRHVFMNLGVGISLVKEIARDPFVADLLFSVYSCAYDTSFCVSEGAPNLSIDKKSHIIKSMPPMKVLAQCVDDYALSNKIGSDAFSLLKWIILDCRSNFLYLTDKLRIHKFHSSGCFQFMALTSTPEQESIFQQLKKRYGSIYLWHGSSTERWHAIIRNGLKNATGTNLQANGNALGSGIYFAPDSTTSLGYSISKNNPYRNSAMPENLQIIALCEVVNLPRNSEVTETVVVVDGKNNKKITKRLHGCLKDHGWAFTLTLEEACIVRFLFVSLSCNENVYKNPPKNIPNLNQVLKLRAKV